MPASPTKLLLSKDRHLTLIDPDGKNEKSVTEERDYEGPRLSPDGRKIAVVTPTVNSMGRKCRSLHVHGIDEKGPGTDLGVECAESFGMMTHWSADGTEIYYRTTLRSPELNGFTKTVHGIVNVTTKKNTPLELAENHLVIDWSRDGKLFLSSKKDFVKTRTGNDYKSRLYLLNRDGTEHRALTDEKQYVAFGRLSSDGRRVLYVAVDKPTVTWGPALQGGNLCVLNISTGKVTTVGGMPLDSVARSYCWSPDGTEIAYVWHVALADQSKEPLAKLADKLVELHLVVCDSDGKNAKTIATQKSPAGSPRLAIIDWR